MPRSRLILAHLIVDLLTIPILCLSLWAGTLLGTALTGEIKVDTSGGDLNFAQIHGDIHADTGNFD